MGNLIHTIIYIFCVWHVWLLHFHQKLARSADISHYCSRRASQNLLKRTSEGDWMASLSHPLMYPISSKRKITNNTILLGTKNWPKPYKTNKFTLLIAFYKKKSMKKLSESKIGTAFVCFMPCIVGDATTFYFFLFLFSGMSIPTSDFVSPSAIEKSPVPIGLLFQFLVGYIFGPTKC